ncbi:hypothetical protein GDO86_020560 [Hymenochirus boettgeri]|uniref:Uncharacterized protein n=1 Tax=Hymenochirus boettgeri TaxID=247094 RepID=A0A8T2IEL1_9PIPI|nr:hypothetical protein GDO86_020560 [Hymenochirus boettgeri]
MVSSRLNSSFQLLVGESLSLRLILVFISPVRSNIQIFCRFCLRELNWALILLPNQRDSVLVSFKQSFNPKGLRSVHMGKLSLCRVKIYWAIFINPRYRFLNQSEISDTAPL